MTFDERLKNAEDLVKQDKYLEALDIYSQLSVERPFDNNLLQTSLRLFDKICDGYYDFTPKTATEYLFRGVSKFYKGELLSSSLDYDKAISLDPNLEIAHYYRTINYRESGKNEDAILEIKKALAKKEHGTYYDALAESLFRLGRVKESLEAHELAIRNSVDARIWFNYGAHLSKAGDNKNAIIKLKKAIEIDPYYHDAQRALAYIIGRFGNQ